MNRLGLLQQPTDLQILVTQHMQDYLLFTCPFAKQTKTSSVLRSQSRPQAVEVLLSRMFSSVQFSRSVMSDSLQHHDRSTPGLPVHHQLPEFTQTHVHRVSDAIQPSHPLSSPSPPARNPSQHQRLFQ